MAAALVVVRAFGAREMGDLIVCEDDIRSVLEGEHRDHAVRLEVPADIADESKGG